MKAKTSAMRHVRQRTNSSRRMLLRKRQRSIQKELCVQCSTNEAVYQLLRDKSLCRTCINQILN